MIYEGKRHPEDELGETSVTVDGKPLPPRLDLRNHSPTGFEWGYSGSGPAQLALAILAHHFREQGRYRVPEGEEDVTAAAAAAFHPKIGDERALRIYQHFKARVVAGFGDEWTLTTEQIDAVVAALGECGACR